MHRISVPLNRQQLELIDRTLASAGADNRAALLKQALHDFMARLAQTPGGGKPPGEPQP